MMQFHAILSQSGSGNLEDAESLDGAFLEKFSSFEHPARGTLDILINQTVRMPKPERIVWEQAFAKYQDFTKTTCQEFLTVRKTMIEFRLKKFNGRPFMKDLCSFITRKNHPSLTFKEAWEVGIVKNSFNEFSRKKRKAWKKEHLESYYDVVALNPHFLLLESRVLTLNQIKSVIQRMSEFQAKCRARLENLQGSELLSLVPFLDQAGMSLQSLMIEQYHWSEGHTEEVIKDLRAAHAKKNSTKNYIQMGGLVGAMVACQLLPIGRARLFIRSACMFSLGLPLDIYFITDASLQRMKTVQDFSNSPEGEYLILKADAISEANQELLFNLLFMPLDIPAAATMNSAKNIIRKIKR